MKDLYLRFENAAEMRRILLEFGFSEEYGQLCHSTVSLDIIGEITNDEQPQEVVEGVFIDEPELSDYTKGYHANIRIPDDDIDTSALDTYAISPETPSRVWA